MRSEPHFGQEGRHVLREAVELRLAVLVEIGYVLRDDTGPAAVRAPDAIDRVGR